MLNVALMTNEDFAPYCATAIASVLRNVGKDTELSFHILTSGLSQEVKGKFYGLKAIKDCAINFVHVNKDDFKDLPLSSANKLIPIESYYRFNLFLGFPELDKILYLDGDMVVLGDITELFNINIDGYCLGMVKDAMINVGSIIHNVKHRLQMPPDSNYFNNGVMLINLKECRKHGAYEKLFSWARNNKDKLVWMDQDTVNAALHDKIKEIPEKYNIQLTYRNNHVALNEVEGREVIHYAGPQKPWNTRGMFLSEHFWENYYPFMAIQN